MTTSSPLFPPRNIFPSSSRAGRSPTHRIRTQTYGLYQNTASNVAVASIHIGVAAGMFFGAIYNMFYVHSLTKRLGIVAGYTVAFAIWVALLSDARRSAIFSACAAYAVALVVFVSGNLSSQSPS
ncbi:uncharacterized protein A1O5_02081 [Cladophialophora psammophila CBS 110553]|uniref:DUF6594 domain-containing protein n=1 Tax=Cladophialophora psammophila CBS 110553 TaxID=1182543 RepID=W9XDJ8_9EURO|nr:uncharacterized protein A1O5_02081 [Cladophialophora psammophila CBS 110553]EXJ75385.1 hypothetical protein A1O5_02081 [Cladophialophora psammophila CBS 110553]